MDDLRPEPLFLFREMITGSLNPNTTGNPSGALHLLLSISPGEFALRNDAPLNDYLSLMQPVYRKLASQSPQRNIPVPHIHQPGVGDEATILRANSPQTFNTLPDPAPSLQLPEPYTTCQPVEELEDRVAIFPPVIRREADRQLSIMNDLLERRSDPGLLLQEFRTLFNRLTELLSLLSSQGEPQHPVHAILFRRLHALYEEARLRIMEIIPPSESHYISTLRPPPQFVARTPAFWKNRMGHILSQWTAKYYKTAPIDKFCSLIDQIDRESATHPELSTTSRHAQIILLLMVLRRISSDAVKQGVAIYKNAVRQLRLVDERIQHGGETAKESAEIFRFDERLEEADAKQNITRFPLIQKRYSRIREVLNTAFQHQDRLPAQSPPAQTQNGELPSAIERLRNQYFTIQQLADYHGVKDRTIRRNINNYNINTIKRAGKQYIPFKEYVKDTEGS